VTTGTQAVRQAAASPWPERLARLGLAARGVLYIVIGILAVRIAIGHSRERANQSGALKEVAAQPGGKVLVWVIAIGLVGYALWRLLTALLGSAADPAATGAKERVKALAEGIGYGSVAVLALKVATGSSSSSGSGSKKAATVLSWTGGQFLVGALGALIAGVGLYLVVEGWRADFTKELNLFRVGPTARRIVIQLGRFGRIARGAAFVLIGILVVVAAVTYDPSKAQGLDGALRTLAQQPFGTWLLAVIAVGFVAFGCYGLAESRLRRIG
jgi:hypothetical protein